MKRVHMLFLAFLMAAVALSACSSDEQKKQSHFAKGKEYFDKGEYKSARIEFKNAVQIDPRFAQAHLMLGETSLKLGDAQDAFRSYSAVAEIEPANTEAQLKLATFLLLGQKYPDARKRVDDILAREPNNVEALLLLATLYGHDENLFEAANCFKKVIEINSRETRAYLGLARVLAQQGQTAARRAGADAGGRHRSPIGQEPTGALQLPRRPASVREGRGRDPQDRRRQPRQQRPAHHDGQLLPGAAPDGRGRGGLPEGDRRRPEET